MVILISDNAVICWSRKRRPARNLGSDSGISATREIFASELIYLMNQLDRTCQFRRRLWPGHLGGGLPRSFTFAAAGRRSHREVEAQPPCCASLINGICGSPYAGWLRLRIHQRGFRFRSPCACFGRSSRIWFNRSSAMAGAMTKDEIVVMPPRLKAKASLTGLACLVMVFSPENTTLLLVSGRESLADTRTIGWRSKSHKLKELRSGLKKLQGVSANSCNIQSRKRSTAFSLALSSFQTR